jgi:poly(A) polymerase
VQPNKHHLIVDIEAYPEVTNAYKIIQRLNEAGHQAVLAGGAVRDLYLNKKPKDFDVATSAEPEEILKCFKRTQKVGIAFGVVLIHDFGIATEVATFRKDGEYTDGRRPDNVIFTDAQNDAQRRDFSVNGMFYDFNEQTILDYVDGLSDLKTKTIRAIRNPLERFEEDFLRMIRAIRFALVLNFEIENKTLEALKKCAHKIVEISPDRIHVELKKCFNAMQPNRAIKLLDTSKLLKFLFNNANPGSYFLNDHPYLSGGDFIANLCLLNATEKSIQDLNQKLIDMRCTNDEKREVKNLFKFKDDLIKFSECEIYTQKRIIRKCETKRLLYLSLNLGASKENIKALEDKIQLWKKEDLYPDLMPTGNQLIKAGLKPNQNMGKYMEKLENDLLEGKINKREDVETHLKEYLSKNPN